MFRTLPVDLSNDLTTSNALAYDDRLHRDFGWPDSLSHFLYISSLLTSRARLIA